MPGCKFHTYHQGMQGFIHREGNVFNEARINRLVCSNRNILSDGKSLFQAFLHNTWGISKVGYLFSKDNILLYFSIIINLCAVIEIF